MGLFELTSFTIRRVLLNSKKYYSNNNNAVKRFKIVPTELFRISTSDKVKLREKEAQLKKNLASFDFTLKNKLVLPAEGEKFTGC